MQIKFLYAAAAVITLAVVAGLEIETHAASTAQQSAIEEAAWIDSLATAIYQINTLSNEVTGSVSPRAAAQWQRRHSSLGSILARHTDNEPLARRLTTMASYHAKIGQVFEKIRSAHNGADGADGALRTDPQAVRLRTLVDALASEADALAAENQRNLAEVWERSRQIEVLFNGTMITLLVGLGLIVAFRVLRPLLSLREGIRTFADGRPDFRFDALERDEIGEVKSAFNQMADSLDRTMVSRDRLLIEIAGRRRVEEDLARSESDLRAILDNLVDVFYRTDSAGRVTMVSRSIETVLGYAPDEVVGRRAADFHYDREGRDRLLAALDANDGRVRDFEVRMRHKSGHPVWISTSSHRRAEADGGAGIPFPAIEGVFRSIEERKHLEKRLWTQVTLTRSLIDASDDAAILIDTSGCLLAANAVFAQRFGRPAEHLVGTSVWEMFPPDLARSRKAACDEALAGGAPVHICDERDGLHYSTAIFPVRNADGRIECLAAFSRDVTAAVESRRRIDTYITEIKRSNEELENFAYVASHDLREPLRMVSSYLSLIERRYGGQIDQDGRDFIAFARDGAVRMDRLVLELLELSRIGRHGAPLVPMPLKPAIDQALAALGSAIAAQRATVDIAASFDDRTIVGDVNQIALLFQNLIGNAIKYHAPDRAPQVRIGCDESGADPVYFIADNGIGINPGNFERIFGIFQRLHTREEYEGTGIGLALCRKIVERHGGRIWLESEPGRGSTFHFTLPGPAAG